MAGKVDVASRKHVIPMNAFSFRPTVSPHKRVICKLGAIDETSVDSVRLRSERPLLKFSLLCKAWEVLLDE